MNKPIHLDEMKQLWIFDFTHQSIVASFLASSISYPNIPMYTKITTKYWKCQVLHTKWKWNLQRSQETSKSKSCHRAVFILWLMCHFGHANSSLSRRHAISKRKKLQIPDTTQMKDISKGFTGVTNFNPFFLCYAYLWFKIKVLKIRHFLCPQGYIALKWPWHSIILWHSELQLKVDYSNN